MEGLNGFETISKPSYPEPKPYPEPYPEQKGNGFPLPGSWRPDHEHLSLASVLSLDCDREALKFRDYNLSRDSRRADWAAEFRNWLRRAAEFAGTVAKPKSEKPYVVGGGSGLAVLGSPK